MLRAFADEAEQRVFRDELEQMLREGKPEAALECVRSRLRGLSDPKARLVDVALTTEVDDLTVTSWAELTWRIEQVEDYGNEPVTALSINFSWPEHFYSSSELSALLENEPKGNLSPILETNYHGDMRVVKFSSAGRTDILKGYGSSGSEWQGAFIDVDNLIGVQGLDAVYGAIQASKACDTDTSQGDACVLASCACAILVHLAVKRAIETQGLPKPMAVLVGSNEDFPFFDAPVVSVDESAPFVRVFEQQEAMRRAKMDASFARAKASREQENAKQTRFDPFEAMEHFGEAAKAGQDMLKLMRKEKDIFLGIGAVGLAVIAHALRNRK